VTINQPHFKKLSRWVPPAFAHAFLLFCTLILTLLCFSSAALAAEPVKIELTPKEKTWLAEHPEITLGTATSYPPFVIKRDDGRLEGVLVDYLEVVSQALNQKIRLHVDDPWSKVQEKAEKGEIDGLAIGAESPGRAVLYHQTEPLLKTYFSAFARSKGEHNIQQFSDLDGLRIGYKGGASPTIALLNKLPAATLKPYDDNEALTQALLSKEVDVVVAWISYEYFRKNRLQGTIDNILLIDESPMDMVTHIRKDWPELVSIMNKVIAAMKQEELPRIMNKWFLEWPKQAARESGVNLTPEEKSWLKAHPVIRTQFNHHPPYMIANKGEIAGLTADLLKIVSERADIQIQIEKTPGKWTDLLARLKRHEDLDMLPAIMPTPERERFIHFTEPYTNSPRFIFTRDDAPFIVSIEGLYTETVAVVSDFAVHKELEKKHPDIELIQFDNPKEAIKAVSEGNAFAFIGDMISTPTMINSLGLQNLKAACPSGLTDHPLSIGVRKDWPELRDILSKAIKAIPANEKTAILNKWSTIRVEYGVRSSDIQKWSIIITLSVLSIITMFLIWNKQLSRKVLSRTAELTESEDRFRATFEQAAVGIAHVSPDGNFLRLNQKFCDIVGYSQKELLALTFQNITHPDDLETDTGLVQELLDGKNDSYTLEKRYLRKDGSTVWVNLTVKILREDDGSPRWFVSVVQDISDRIRIQQEIKKSYEFLNHLTQAIPDAIFAVKLPERTVTWCSDTYGVLGYETNECIGETTAKFYPTPDEAKQFGTLMEKAIAEGKKLVQTELELRRKNGEIFPADVKLAFLKEGGHVVGVTALLRDISQRKQAEDELQQSHDFLNYLISSIPDAVFYVKLPERVIAWANDSYNIMGLGDDPEHLKGLSTRDFFASEEEFERFGEVQRQAIEDGKSFMHTEAMLRHENGTVFPADITGTFFKENGKVVSITAIVRDITEVKLAEKKFVDYQERLKALTSQLTIAEEQERRRIAENLHDEVSQALAMTRLQLAAAIRGTICDDSRLKEQLNEISGSLLQAIRDTRQLIFELSSPSMHELGLGSAIIEWVEEKKRQLKNDVDIAIVNELTGTELDEDERTILFRNIRELLTNTFKHARAKKVKITLVPDEETVRATVEDDGIGFDSAQVLDGYSLDGGFGLFSIEERMKDLNGTMKVEAAPHKGCKVTLSLPRAME
jgi:PAS domain S-box-containing protein